jgi:hypothetical protein
VGLLHARAAGTLPINFIQPRQPRQQADPAKQRLVLAAVAVVLFYALLTAASVFVLKPRWQEQRDAQLGEKQSIEGQLALVKDEAKKYKDLDTWDSPVWLDEIYNLAARIHDISALRISELTVEPIPRTAKSPYSAKLTLKGTVQPSMGVTPSTLYEKLKSEFAKERTYYNIVPSATDLQPNNQFKLTFEVKRRGPADHKLKVDAPKQTAGTTRPTEDAEDE